MSAPDSFAASSRPMQDAVAWVVGGAGSLGQTIAGALAEAGPG